MHTRVHDTRSKHAWISLIVLPLVASGFTASTRRIVHASELTPIQVVWRETPNLVYELECVSGATLACSRETYRSLWEREILRDDDDRAALTTVREIYRRQAERPARLSTRSSSGSRPRNADSELRLAGLLARSPDDYATRITKLVSASDGAALVAAVRRFAPRFHAIWQREAQASGAAFASELERELARPELRQLLQQLVRFYDVDPKLAKPVAMVALYRPADDGDNSGEQVDHALLFEVRSGDSAVKRLDIAVHELCHYAWSVSRAQTVAALETRFDAPELAAGRAAYHLFNEATATAIGNGLAARLLDPAALERKLKQPNGLYNQTDVDRAAKALMPWLAVELTNGLTIASPTFVEHYYTVLGRRFGMELEAPRLALLKSYVFLDTALSFDIHPAIREILRPNYLSLQTGQIDAPELPAWLKTSRAAAGLFVIAPGSLDGMVKLGLLDANERGQLAHSLARSEHGAGPRPSLLFSKIHDGEPLFVVVGDDATGIRRGLQRLAALNSRPLGLVP